MTNEESEFGCPEPVILTLRLIRSFEHRNLKLFVVKIPSVSMLVKDFKVFINEGNSDYFKMRFNKFLINLFLIKRLKKQLIFRLRSEILLMVILIFYMVI